MNLIRIAVKLVITLCCGVILAPVTAKACTAVPMTPRSLAKSADVIVRATAVRYEKFPDTNMRTTGVPDSTVLFLVAQVLKGEKVPHEIIINGYLVDQDDLNDRPAPYDFIRPGGRGGSCYANSYKDRADFLLFLKKTENGFTPYWAPLSATNEQLRKEKDPWLSWVTGYLRAKDEKPKHSSQ